MGSTYRKPQRTGYRGLAKLRVGASPGAESPSSSASLSARLRTFDNAILANGRRPRRSDFLPDFATCSDCCPSTALGAWITASVRVGVRQQYARGTACRSSQGQEPASESRGGGASRAQTRGVELWVLGVDTYSATRK